MMLEILHGALVGLRGFFATERAQVATAAGLSILFAREQAVLAAF